ncbi:MAG: methionyl-tRNA formyltransferase [Polyangiaceae bacterium]|jgi:methionyl-tRNA formyltransferase|nr:methionyl-tRNA formyltransferase [Polyangiaceae bacterium]
MRALFFGTPEIAVPALEALHRIAEVSLVVCQPDRPAGRGLAPKVPAVKARALELGLEVAQPAKVRTPELAAQLAAQRADVAVVMAYGRILPKAVLEAPRLGCVNLHASILPKYRGAAPITWAIVDGEAVTGVSLMSMDEGMDTGPVFAIREVAIGPDTTAGELSALLAACAAGVVSELLPKVVSGELTAVPQDHAKATHARMLEKADGAIDWAKPARRVHDHVRGMTPWPGAFTTVSPGTKTLKILETRRMSGDAGAPPGTVVVAHRGRIEVACGEGRVEVVRAQLEGKKALGAAELVGGRALAQGMVLGERAAESDGPPA